MKEFSFMIRKILFTLVCLFLAVGVAFAAIEKKDKGKNVEKGAIVGHLQWFDINNLMFAVQNNGSSSYDPIADHAGFFYPKGTGTAHTAIYQDGLVWGGKVKQDHDSVRVGGSAYIQGLQEGKVIGANPGNADDPTKPSYRVYRIRKDWQTAKDITEAERAQYQKDYDEWPAADGAPVGPDGKPLFIGDQVLWYVANDYNPANTLKMYGSPPIGIEQQVLIWGYDQPGALGNMAFKRYVFINKGGKNVDSMYVSQWADPDLGQADNDIVGCHSVLGIGYIYNATAYDAQYGFTPPSAGFDFFQGPRVKSSGDSAIFLGKRIYGYKNLGMTSFTLFDRTVAAYSDPPQGTYEGTMQWWNLLRGLQGRTGRPFVDPVTGIPSKYVANGDPVKRTGWIDGITPVPGDRRMCLNSGPFTLAPGDTQEVVVAMLAAQGTDRLSSVALLKFYDQQAQLAYDNFFNVPGPPPPPKVSVAELDGKIVLSWGDPVRAQATESYNVGGYKFEGYNVYQLPTPTVKSKDDAKLIQVFDIPNNNVTVILDQVFDPTSGLVLQKPVQFGNDINGVQHNIVITQDWIRGVPLVNNQTYYFAVTAYSYNPSPTAVPSTLENSIKAISSPITGLTGVTPQSTKLGVRFPQTAGDTLKVTHVAGSSEGTVTPLILNPTALTGHNYEISFDTTAGTLKWKLKDQNTGEILYTSDNVSGTGFYPDIDGFNIMLVGPPAGMKDWSVEGTTRWWTWAGGAGDFGMEGFYGAIGWGGSYPFAATSVTPDKVHNVLIEFAETDLNGNLKNPTDPNSSLAYRFGRNFAAAPAKPEFAPFIINKAGGYSYQDRRPICLKVTDIETNKRLDVAFLENNVAGGSVDGKWWPPDYNVASNVSSAGPREWLWIFATEYSEATKPELTQGSLAAGTWPIMYFATVARRGNVAPVAGAKFKILANHPFALPDRYTFTAVAPTYDAATAVADVARINVFPNPYFGFNMKETDKAQRFVTFSHLPQKAKIRIFTLAGSLIKTIDKDDATQFAKWDLRNETGLPVASGMYIAHIDMSDLGLGNKVLKLAIIQEAQFLDQVPTFFRY